MPGVRAVMNAAELLSAASDPSITVIDARWAGFIELTETVKLTHAKELLGPVVIDARSIFRADAAIHVGVPANEKPFNVTLADFTLVGGAGSAKIGILVQYANVVVEDVNTTDFTLSAVYSYGGDVTLRRVSVTGTKARCTSAEPPPALLTPP